MRKINRLGFEYFVVDDTKNSFFWDIETWETGNYEIIKKLSDTHDVFVHAGGWIGPFTLFASNLYKKVYCLEPDPVAFFELEQNVKYNNYENVFLDRRAFLNEEKEIIIGDSAPLGTSVTNIFQKANGVKVDTVSLKNYFKENNIPKNSFLMLDVEGAEYLLFDDFEFFEIYRPTILISYHLTFLSDENFNYLINSLIKLQDLYEINIEELLEQRKTLTHGSCFVELNYLYHLKNEN